jgi:NTP pyrophosphatase (non-canonical NTP hydrolase)
MSSAVRLQNVFTAWRIKVAPWHPLPDANTCLLYLVSEIGEACDAVAFAQRPHDDRSHHKERHLGRELAQVVDMAYATAIRHGIDLDVEIDDWLSEVVLRGVKEDERKTDN